MIVSRACSYPAAGQYEGALGEEYRYTGKVIVDATYEADLGRISLTFPYRIGREARSKEEPHAGHIYTNYFRTSQRNASCHNSS